MRFLILFCLFFSSCSKPSTHQHRAARIHLASDPTSLDPRMARDLESVTLLHMLFEGLTRMSHEGKVELALAEKVEVLEEGLRYVFSLRESRWSNGRAVVADDFVKGWKAILDPQFASDVAYHLYGIKNARRAKKGEVSVDEVGVWAKDAKTLLVALEHPIPYFLELLTMTPFFPVPETNRQWALSPTTWVSNGPFLLRKWSHADALSLVKNSHYWQAEEVALEQIDLIIADADTGLRMFEQGALDWTGSPLATIPAEAIASLKGQLQVSPFAATYFFRVNTASEIRGKRNPLSQPQFRKALALSLDRRAIAEHILQGGHQPATGLVPPEMGLEERELFDVARAKEWMAEMKREWGEVPAVVLSYIPSERGGAIAQAVQQQWERGLGISVELERVEPKVYFQRVSKGEFQLAAGSWTADFEDPINFLEVFKYKDASTNNTGWERAEYIDLLDRSALCRDSKERRALLCEAEKMLLDELPVIPLFHFALNYLKRDPLKGIALSGLGQLDLRWAYWDE